MEGPLLSDATVRQHGNSLQVQHGGDASLIVRFYMEAERQGAESEKAGRPIYKDVPYIHIQYPGDRTREVKRKVDLSGRRSGIPDPERFSRQWMAFQNQQEQPHEGTPIEEWGPITKSLALTYKGMNIHTVEQLAGIPDSNLHNLGHGARTVRDKAISWLKQTAGSAELLALKKENTDLRDDLEAVKQQLQALGKKPKK